MRLGEIYFALVLFLVLPCISLAIEGIKSERVQFPEGETKVSISAQIVGDETVDYLLKVKEGQELRVSLKTGNGANYFNILAPNEDYIAFFNGSLSDPLNEYSGKVPASGDLKIRVYL
ncbi:MAG: hypothetical protein KDD70_15430, partial [Bdellovibrionales bacterium]|nr:hypothetical protein [Bdellovibrionales bacterium]